MPNAPYCMSVTLWTACDPVCGNVQMDGLRPQTVWFADKPSRRGGQLNTSDFLGKEFIQYGTR